MRGSWLVLCLLALTAGSGPPHIRRRRWLSFPKGSSLQLVYCWLLSTFGTRDGIFVINVTVGLAWEIPQNFRQLLEKEARPTLESRHRRQIYSRLATLIDRQGFEGHKCILRAICEAKRVSGSKQKFVHSLLEGLFTLPDLDEDHEDFQDHSAYKYAQDHFEDCQKHFPCPFNVLHF